MNDNIKALKDKEVAIKNILEVERDEIRNAKTIQTTLLERKKEIENKIAKKGYSISNLSENIFQSIDSIHESCIKTYSSIPVDYMISIKKIEADIPEKWDNYEAEFNKLGQEMIKEKMAIIIEESTMLSQLQKVMENIHSAASTLEETHRKNLEELKEKIKKEGIEDPSKLEEEISAKIKRCENALNEIFDYLPVEKLVSENKIEASILRLWEPDKKEEQDLKF